MEKQQESLKSYIVGFVLSLILTLGSYFIVTLQLITSKALTLTLIGFASLQAILQLLLFLHLGQESKPRWNLMVFLFMVMVVLIVILGSIWIMYHLDYNMTASE